jgi:hypothetical protein
MFVLCNETGEIFEGYKIPKEKYGAHIAGYFNKNSKYSGTLPDGTKLTWTKLNKNDIEQIQIKVA